MGCAAALITVGHPIVGIEKSNRLRLLFCFEDSLMVRKNAEEYWSGGLLLSANSYYGQIKSLKGRIHAETAWN